MRHSIFARRPRLEFLEARRLLATVDTLADVVANDGFTSLREAIAAAAPGEMIDFSVTGVIQLSLSGHLAIDKDLSINGPGADLLTIRAYDLTPEMKNGDGGRAFFVDDGASLSKKTVSISGLTLTGGDVSGGGGAIACGNEEINLTDMTISGNSASVSGGGVSTGGILRLTKSIVSGNETAGVGGGLRLFNGGAIIDDSWISDNTAEAYGGGISLFFGGMTVARTTISGNVAGGAGRGGGGIHADGAIMVEITDSTIRDNRITDAYGHGGGLFVARNLTLTNSTVSGNSTSGEHAHGGGIYVVGQTSLIHTTVSGNSIAALDEHGGGIVANGNLTLAHSTVTGNSVPFFGNVGGIFMPSGIYPNNLTVANSIIAGNVVDLGADAPTLSANYSLFGFTAGNDAQIMAGVGNILGVNPALGPLADNGGPTMTHALLAGSPAIDAGDPNFNQTNPDGDPLTDDALPYDQRGFAFSRVVGGRIDVGAYEGGATSANFDGDLDVDGADFLRWQRGQGSTGAAATYPNGNADVDGDVDGDDLAVWKTQFGANAAVAAAAPAAADAVFASGDLAALIAPSELPVRRPWRPRRR